MRREDRRVRCVVRLTSREESDKGYRKAVVSGIVVRDGRVQLYVSNKETVLEETWGL